MNNMSAVKPDIMPEEILTIVRAAKNKTILSTTLCKKLRLDKPALDKHIAILRSWGYKLRYTNTLIKLLTTPDALIDTELGYQLKTTFIGKTHHTYQTVRSTNDIAAGLAANGAVEGTIVTAEQQTAGKGRLGRKWHSPSGKGVYVSIVLRPKLKPEQAPGLSIMTALALAETVETFCDGHVRIKWPNDLLIDTKKAAGILTELYADNGNTNYVIVGVGINVNHTLSDFPDELHATATSLRRANKSKVDRVALLKEFLYRFEKRYRAYVKSKGLTSLSKIKSYSSLLNNRVTLRQGHAEISGIAKEITKSGALVLKNDAGKLLTITSGEVTIVKK